AQAPGREYRLLVPIDDRDLLSARHVHEDAQISVCELERLGMTCQLDLSGELERCRVDRGQCAAIADIDTSAAPFITHVVGVLEPVDVSSSSEWCTGEDIDASTSPVGHEQALRFRYECDALRLLQVLESRAALARAQVDHFDGIVA